MAKANGKRTSEFGSRLRRLREERSLTATELAKRVDVTPAAIWHWEKKGLVPKPETLKVLEKVLGAGLLSSEIELPHRPMQSRANDMDLEELIRAIEAKGFVVQIRTASRVP